MTSLKLTACPLPIYCLRLHQQGAEYEAFKSSAAKVEDVMFVETTDADVAKAAGITAAPGVALIKNFKGAPLPCHVYLPPTYHLCGMRY